MPTESSYSAVAAPNPSVDATVQHRDGTGAFATVIPAGARSVSVVVHAGTATVQMGADPVAALPPGSYTWGADHGGDDGERLADGVSVSGGVGDVVTVLTTREV